MSNIMGNKLVGRLAASVNIMLTHMPWTRPVGCSFWPGGLALAADIRLLGMAPVYPMRWRIRLIGLALLGAAAAGQAATVNRHVATNSPDPGSPYDTWANAAHDVKTAVDAANANDAGDTVWISNGTYVLTAQINISNTIVRSWGGQPQQVIVDGNYNAVTNRCFYLNHSGARLADITISNGCAIASDLNGSGGGVYVQAGSVENCQIINNRAYPSKANCGGGGIYLDAEGQAADCLIRTNTAYNNVQLCGGGGAMINGGRLAGGLIADNVSISNNNIFADGGGVFLCNDGKVIGCVISNNQAYTSDSVSGGGGLFTSSGIVSNCVIIGNYCSNRGGGIRFRRAGDVFNTLIVHNSAGAGGGVGIESPGWMWNCTIVSNYASGNGGGLRIFSDDMVSNIINCVIYYNHSDNSSSYHDIHISYTSSATGLTHCCVAPGYPISYIIENVITNPPLFSDDSYRLDPGSSCINVGMNANWMFHAVDLDGRSRIDRYIRRVDLGCYEYVAQGMLFNVR